MKNLSILVDALQSSQDVLRNLNQNLAAVTGLLSNDPNELGNAVADINAVVGDVQSFVADNRESLGTTSDKLAALSTTLSESLEDIKQVIHVGAPAFSNFLNIYEPAQGALTGILSRRISFRIRCSSSAGPFRRRPGWVPSNRRNCACSIWRRS